MASEQMIREHSVEESETRVCVIKQHLNLIKWFGVIRLASVVILTVVMESTFNHRGYTQLKQSIAMKPNNTSTCHFVKQFDLLDLLNMSVCNIQRTCLFVCLNLMTHQP